MTVRAGMTYPDNQMTAFFDTLPQVVAVYKDDGARGHHMDDFIPKEELAKFMAKCGDDKLAQQVGDHLNIVCCLLDIGNFSKVGAGQVHGQVW